MKVIIAGSRGLTDYAVVCHAVQRSGFPISRVLSGMARGVDSLAVRYAAENGLPLDPYPARWSELGRSAGYKRNVQMARNADGLIALWDGQSPGTRHMIEVAKARGLQVFVALCRRPPAADKRLIEAAMQEAANDAIRLHQRLGLPLVGWHDGKIVLVPADQLAAENPKPLQSPSS
jgi:hypothetical protein